MPKITRRQFTDAFKSEASPAHAGIGSTGGSGSRGNSAFLTLCCVAGGASSNRSNPRASRARRCGGVAGDGIRSPVQYQSPVLRLLHESRWEHCRRSLPESCGGPKSCRFLLGHSGSDGGSPNLSKSQWRGCWRLVQMRVCMQAAAMVAVGVTPTTTGRTRSRCSENSFASIPPQRPPVVRSSAIRSSPASARQKSGAWA